MRVLIKTAGTVLVATLLGASFRDSPRTTREVTARAMSAEGSLGAKMLKPATFDTLFKRFKPQPHESKWDQIPWMTDVWEARKKAAAEGKPLFIYCSNCPPLAWT